MLGANGIVGAGGPLACGSALMAKVKKTDQVSVSFFGDGAAEQGTMHESMNLASIWKLPVIFLCENNGYAQTTPVHYHCAAKDISDRATAYNIPGFIADGTDFFAVYEAVGEAIARARRGEGPSLLECKGFRYFGHFQGDNLSYFSEDELARNRANDPIDKFKKRVVDRGLASAAELTAVDAKVKKAIDDAVAFAEASPWPAAAECYTDVYVKYP
jgi:pyruvate dehydrogenase E1 component alpha subunit